MKLLASRFHWLMLLSGALTSTMVVALFAPQTAARSTFGAALEGPVADVVVRNWGGLIALVGAMLIYGAFKPAVRGLVLTVAASSKAIFIALVLAHGSAFLAYAAIALAVDAVMVVLFVGYLIAAPRSVATGVHGGGRRAADGEETPPLLDSRRYSLRS